MDELEPDLQSLQARAEAAPASLELENAALRRELRDLRVQRDMLLASVRKWRSECDALREELRKMRAPRRPPRRSQAPTPADPRGPHDS
jgi:uncharacterized coiled-coil DUF342 family protein